MTDRMTSRYLDATAVAAFGNQRLPSRLWRRPGTTWQIGCEPRADRGEPSQIGWEPRRGSRTGHLCGTMHRLVRVRPWGSAVEEWDGSMRARAAVLALVVLVGLGSGAALSPSMGTTTGPQCGTAVGTAPATFDHVVLIVFENKYRRQIIGNTAAPYLNSLATQCGQAKNMNAIQPIASLPNYIALTSGTTGSPVDITTDKGPRYYPQNSVSLFELLNGNWNEWAENMPGACSAKSAFDYSVHHNPALYYTRIPASVCQAHDLPMPATPDISAAFTLITPNQPHIMHEDDAPGVTTQTQRIIAGDTWLAGYLPMVFASPQYQQGRTAVIITWDEGNGSRNVVPFIVASPYTPAGYTTTAYLDHYSTLKGIEEMLGLSPLLGHAADPTTDSIRNYFGLR